MRFGFRTTFLVTLLLSTPLVFAQGSSTTDPETDANTSLGVKDAPAVSASAPTAKPRSSDPALEPRATPVAKDLQPDDVVVQEIHTQSTPSAKNPKHAAAPVEEESGTARDTLNEQRGSAPIGEHDTSAPAESSGSAASSDDGKENAATADSMTMKLRPAGEQADVTPTPAEKQKPRRMQRGAAPKTAVEKLAAQKSEKKSSKKKTVVTEKAVVASKAEAAPTAETVLKWLSNGNTRFVKKHLRADGKSPADRARLEKAEHPHAAILASADSRVVPEIVFDQALGEVYDVRAFGEGLDSATVAALEYAVAKLKVPVLVVMGNSDCAAIRTMLEDKVNENGDHVGDGPTSPDIEKIIADIKPRLKTLKDDPVSPGYEVEATLNADGIARELVRRSDIIREAVEKNALVIKSALYRLDSGKVSFY